MKDLRGIGGWLLVFLVSSVAVSVLLIIGLVALLSNGLFATLKGNVGIFGIFLAVLGNCFAIVWLGRVRARGVPLAQRGLIMTMLATVHLALLQHLAPTPFLEVVLFAAGFMLLWVIYFGFSAYVRRKHVQIDVSRRIAQTYPANLRVLPLAVRTLYSLVIASYAVYLGYLLWHVAVL